MTREDRQPADRWRTLPRRPDPDEFVDTVDVDVLPPEPTGRNADPVLRGLDRGGANG
jgi:hypothetical protein